MFVCPKDALQNTEYIYGFSSKLSGIQSMKKGMKYLDRDHRYYTKEVRVTVSWTVTVLSTVNNVSNGITRTLILARCYYSSGMDKYT